MVVLRNLWLSNLFMETKFIKRKIRKFLNEKIQERKKKVNKLIAVSLLHEKSLHDCCLAECSFTSFKKSQRLYLQALIPLNFLKSHHIYKLNNGNKILRISPSHNWLEQIDIWKVAIELEIGGNLKEWPFDCKEFSGVNCKDANITDISKEDLEMNLNTSFRK